MLNTAMPPVTASSYEDQALELAALNRVEIPLELQLNEFLRIVLSAMPEDGLVGLSVDTQYTTKAGETKNSSIADWVYASDIAAHDFSQWARAMNNRAAYVKVGVGSVFWNVAGRKYSVLDRPFARGSHDELTAVTSFFADYDLMDRGVPLARIHDEILKFVLPPTAIVFSGGGLQPIWALSEPYMIQDRASVLAYKHYAYEFNRLLATYTSESPDFQVAEAARMLRAVGFVNRKKKRLGAVARLVYWQPGNLYTISQITSLLPAPEARVYPVESFVEYKIADAYQVGASFLQYFQYGLTADSGDRHRTLRYLALQAAKAEIPVEVFRPRIRVLAKRWFADTPDRAGSELDSLVNWAYANVTEAYEGDKEAEQARPFHVKPTPDGFERVYDDQAEKVLGDKLVTMKPEEYAEAIGPQPESADLKTVRAEQDKWLDEKFTEKPAIPKVYLLMPSPGAGKTRALLHHAVKLVTEDPAEKVLYVSQFKKDEKAGRQWVEDYGLDPALFGFFIARENEIKSKGFCANFDRAQLIGSKGHNIVKSLCTNGCPFYTACKESGYLSQFRKLENKRIIVGRFNHAAMSELTEDRKTVIFDESALEITTRSITVDLADLALKFASPFIVGQYPQEVALMEQFLGAMRAVMATNPARRSRDIKDNHVKLGGFWLMKGLIDLFGAEKLEQVFSLPDKIIHGCGGLDITNLETIAKSPPNFISDLIDILKYEYQHWFKQGLTRWNSRLIPRASDLLIYPMKAFNFTRDTKVFSADASAMVEYYPVMFTDRHTEADPDTGKRAKKPRPRQLDVFDLQLKPASHVTVYTGTENTKTRLLQNISALNKVELEEAEQALTGLPLKTRYTFADTVKLADRVKKLQGGAIAQAMLMIHSLSIRHNRSLLVIMYKSIAGGEDEKTSSLLRRWVIKSGAIPEENLQWFYNLRGRNDWENTQAVLTIGTPRIQEIDLFILGQVLNYQDPKPIDIERKKRNIPYRGLKLPDGGYQGYQLWSYEDPRIHRLYYHLMYSELRQSTDRIRPNSSNGDRFIYMATALPSTDHVDLMESWELASVYAAVDSVLQKLYYAPDPSAKEIDLIRRIVEAVNCTEGSAKRILARQLDNGYSFAIGGYWRDLFNRSYTANRSAVWSSKEAAESPESLYKTLKPKAFILKWLTDNPAAFGSGNLSKLKENFSLSFPNLEVPSQGTFQKARLEYLQGGAMPPDSEILV